MKKLFTYLCAVFMCVVSAIGLTACKEGVKVTKAEVVSGIETTIVKNTELDTSGVHVKITYSDDTTLEVTSEDLEFGEIDTTTTGNKDLTIKHVESGYVFTIVIRVVEDEADVYAVMSMESELLNEYNAYKKVQTNKENEFYNREEPLYVGDDNAFNFRIHAVGLKENGERIPALESVRTDVVVKLIENDNTKTVLAGDTLAQYVAVNTINAELDFTPAAIGHSFEVTVTATNRDEGYGEEQTTFTGTLTVIDGFNVYDADDLSVYDNKYYNLKQSEKDEHYRSHEGYVAKHQAVAEKYGITLNDIKAIKAVILQDNIEIRDENLLDEFFWQTSTNMQSYTNLPVKGSLINKDHEGLYYRFVEHDEEFQFIGNYFGVDASRISKMVLQISENDVGNTSEPYVNTTAGSESNIKVSCSTLFYTTGIDFSRTGRVEEEGARITWKNLNFFGNGTLDSDPRNSGAILLAKFTKADVNVTNNISRSFLISYLVREYNDGYQGNRATFLFDHCKVYECYQCHLYVAGTNDGTVVRDCEFKRANGPAIMCDFIEVDNDVTKGVPVKLDIVNSIVESFITGEEPWLRTYGADALVSSIKAYNSYFNGTNNMGLPNTGKTFVVTRNVNNAPVEFINCPVYVKADTADPLAANRLSGYVRFYGENADPTDTAKSAAAYAKYQAQDANYQNLQEKALYTLALTSQYTSDTKSEVLTACGEAIAAASQAAGRELNSLEQMAIAQATSMEKFVEYLQAKIGAALVEAGIDPEDDEQMATEEAQQIIMGVVYAQATLDNGGITALSTFIHELADISGQELQMMTLVSYITTVQQLVATDPDHDMPVFGLDFDSTFNWAGTEGLAETVYGAAAAIQSEASGGYLSTLNILTCMPVDGTWAGGADYFAGEYINLYHNAGFGVILQLFPVPQA